MIKHQYETYGAQFLLTIQGQTPSEVTQAVNTYCNYGMFLPAAIPAEFDETRHTSVTINVTQDKMMPALVAIAEARLIATQSNTPRAHRLTGADFTELARLDALNLFATFEKVSAPTVADEAGASADLRDYTLEAADKVLLSGSRKGARNTLLSVFAKVKRDSATGARRGKSE